jgi:Arc/MetJ family transcription regulator
MLERMLVEHVQRMANVPTAGEAVRLALEHYIRSRDYAALLALHSAGGVAEGYDPKSASP